MVAIGSFRDDEYGAQHVGFMILSPGYQAQLAYTSAPTKKDIKTGGFAS